MEQTLNMLGVLETHTYLSSGVNLSSYIRKNCIALPAMLYFLGFLLQKW